MPGICPFCHSLVEDVDSHVDYMRTMLDDEEHGAAPRITRSPFVRRAMAGELPAKEVR